MLFVFESPSFEIVQIQIVEIQIQIKSNIIRFLLIRIIRTFLLW